MKAEGARVVQEEGLAWAQAWRWESARHVRVQRVTQHGWKMGTA